MKTNLLTFILSGSILLISQTGFAVLDDNLGLTDKGQKATVIRPLKKAIVRSRYKSINDKKLVAKTIKEYKRTLASEVQMASKAVKKRVLGAVPSYIQDNWDALSKDQKEIVYSYHNENPYSTIAKDHFEKASKDHEVAYEHDTAYGFDAHSQGSLDDLRADINGSTKDELSEEDQKVVDLLAALEK